MLKLYPSSLEFSFNGVNMATYSSSCWRYFLNTRGVRKELDPAYQEIGAIHERLHGEDLRKRGEEFRDEVPFRLQISDNTVVSGRCDFLLDGRIDETKATFNKQKFNAAPGRDHLSQLVLYLSHFQIAHGRLVYGYFEKGVDGEFIRVDTKTIEVRLLDDGTVLVNDRNSMWSVDDLVKSMVELERHSLNNTIPPKPFSFDFKTACDFCPAKNACLAYESGSITDDELRSQIRLAAERDVPGTAKYKTQKPPKAPKAPKAPRAKKEPKPKTLRKVKV